MDGHGCDHLIARRRLQVGLLRVLPPVGGARGGLPQAAPLASGRGSAVSRQRSEMADVLIIV